MISIAMFNNKGGVGKTTLTCNLAAFFATSMRQRVLVVDCDPQCNSTQLIMGQEFTTQLYWENIQESIITIKNILQPIEDGDSTINKDITPVRLTKAIATGNTVGVTTSYFFLKAQTLGVRTRL
jgi:cellulose biosynthesis protein BcsQ